MSAFEDFVSLELPKRPPMLTLANTSFDGDPNTGSPPAVVANAPTGTFFFRNTGFVLYLKETSSPGSWSVVGSGGVATTAPLTWHVETTGNDTTGDGSVAFPFLTPTGALTKLKDTFSSIENQVDIVLGVGNFPGFMLSGVNITPRPSNLPIGVRVLGTYVAATLTTGTTSGTITARTSGSIVGTVSFTSMTDSTQTWTPDELRGMMLELVTGVGAPQMLPILTNTSDTITYLTTSTTIGSVGGTYQIREWGSVLTSTIQIPPVVPFSGAATGQPTNAVVAVHNPTAANQIQITLEGLRIGTTTAPAGSVGIFASGTPVQIRRCFLGGTGVSTQGNRVSLNGYAAVGSTITSSVLASPGQANTTVFAATNLPTCTYSSCLSGLSTLATGYLPLRIAGQGVALGAHAQFTNVPVATMTTTVMHPLSFGAFFTSCASTTVAVVVNDLLGNNLSAQLNLSGQTSAALSALLLSGGSQTGAINYTQGVRVVATGVFGTGNLYGFRAQPGTRTRIDATTTISGSAADILLSDISHFTLAFLRAQVPKVLQDNYDAHVFEL